jgi:aspartate/methionine/tyrosine aminotransferase
MTNKKFIASRIKDHSNNIVTKMWNIQNRLENVIAMGRGDTDLDTPRHIIDAGINALNNGATHYTHPMGLLELRQEICKDIKMNEGAQYTDEEIVVTAGGQEAMFAIALGILNPGDEIITVAPGYNPYFQAAELADAKTVLTNTYLDNNFAMTAEAVEPLITEKTKILVIINPCNPTGAVTPYDQITKLADLAKKNDLIVISDEIYSLLTFNNHKVQPVASLPGMFDRTITLNGFSKAYCMTGWRVGYFAAPKSLITHLSEIHHGFAICAPSVNQHAAIAALKSSKKCVEDMKRTMEKRCKILCDGLDEINLPYSEPQGGYYVYANVSKTGLNATDFCLKLLEEGKVIIYPGSLYGDHCDDFVRFSLSQPEEKIKEAVSRIKKVVLSL